MRFAYTYDHAAASPDRPVGPDGFDDGSLENVFAGREGERVYAADGDIIRGRDRYSDRRAEPVRARVPRPVPRRQVHRHPGRSRAVLQARAQPVLLHAERRHRQLGQQFRDQRRHAVHVARAARRRLANGNVTFVQANPMAPPVRVHRAVQRRRWSSTTSCRTSACRSARGTSTCSTCRTRKACRRRAPTTCIRVRRLADGSIGRPTPESETTKSYDLGWRLNHRPDHRLGGGVDDRLHRSHRVVVRSRPRLQRRPQRRRRRRCRASTRRSASASASASR